MRVESEWVVVGGNRNEMAMDHGMVFWLQWLSIVYLCSFFFFCSWRGSSPSLWLSVLDYYGVMPALFRSTCYFHFSLFSFFLSLSLSLSSFIITKYCPLELARNWVSFSLGALFLFIVALVCLLNFLVLLKSCLNPFLFGPMVQTLSAYAISWFSCLFSSNWSSSLLALDGQHVPIWYWPPWTLFKK